MAPLTKDELGQFLVSVSSDGELLLSFLGAMVNSIPVIPDAQDVPTYDTVMGSAQRVTTTGPAGLGIRNFVARSDHGHQVADNIIDGSFLGSLLFEYETTLGQIQRVRSTDGSATLGTRAFVARSDHRHQTSGEINRRLPRQTQQEKGQHISMLV